MQKVLTLVICVLALASSAFAETPYTVVDGREFYIQNGGVYEYMTNLRSGRLVDNASDVKKIFAFENELWAVCNDQTIWKLENTTWMEQGNSATKVQVVGDTLLALSSYDSSLYVYVGGKSVTVHNHTLLVFNTNYREVESSVQFEKLSTPADGKINDFTADASCKSGVMLTLHRNQKTCL